jgi:hypothetical protein
MKFKVLLLILLACLNFNLYAQSYKKSHSVEKAFKINELTEIRIVNKYGNVHLIPWEKDSVKFVIDFTITANRQSKVDKIFDNIDFDFTATGHYVIAQTILQNEGAKLWQDITDFTNMLFKGGEKAQIDFKVYLPEGNDLDIQNKFGNVYTTNHSGEFRLTLSNGDFRANHIKAKANIKLDFGNLSVKRLDDAILDIGYSELEIREAGDLNIISKSSVITIDKANEIDLASRRDKFYIGTIAKLTGKSSFSYLKIKELSQETILNTNYGELNIDELLPGFHQINFMSEYTDINLGIPKASNYFIEINYSKKSFLSLPKDIQALTKKTIEEGERFSISGANNSGNEAQSSINISILSGSLQVFKN